MAEQHRADYGPVQAAKYTGLPWEQGLRLGVIPDPDIGHRWSHTLVEDIRSRAAEVQREITRRQPIGANRAAELLTARFDLEVERSDVADLAELGLLRVVETYKSWPLYARPDIDEFTDIDALRQVIAEREAWIHSSIPRWQALERLGIRAFELDEAADKRGVKPGRWKRYAVADIEGLAQDDETWEQIRQDRLIGPAQAAQLVGVRRTDWRYIEAAGWVTPVTVTGVEISRSREVEVPLYRTRDVEALLDMPGVDWEAVHTVQPGDPSPLRAYVRLPPSRGDIIRALAEQLGEELGTKFDASYRAAGDVWILSWEDTDGAPTRGQVRATIRANPVANRYDRDIHLAQRGTGHEQ